MICSALYARISTHEGKQFSENQLIEIRRFAERHGWRIFREYVDEASGSKADRDALTELMLDAHARRFDHVVVFALDRLTREGVLQAFTYLERLKQAGVTFWSVTEPHFSTAGAFGDVMVALSAWIAQQERVRLQERIKAGMYRARENGAQHGRPLRIFDIDRARKLRDSGESWRSIAKTLGIPLTTVRGRVRGPATP